MGRLSCNHYLHHYPSRRVIVDFRVIADFHVIRVVSGILGFLSPSAVKVLTCIRNFSCRFTWIRNQFLLQIDDFGPKHLFLLFFQWVRCVCVVGTFSAYLNAILLHLFQDFEPAVFKPFFYEDVEGFLWNIYFIRYLGVWLRLMGQASVFAPIF